LATVDWQEHIGQSQGLPVRESGLKDGATRGKRLSRGLEHTGKAQKRHVDEDAHALRVVHLTSHISHGMAHGKTGWVCAESSRSSG
jgi:hypothetical protein